MAKLPAAGPRPGTSAAEAASLASLTGTAFQRELVRARRHLAKLEAEQMLRTARPAERDDPVRFDESPAFARACNILIWAIVMLPIALAFIALARRIAG